MNANCFFLSKTPGEIQGMIAGRLRTIRRKRKLSQKKLSELSGVSLGSVKRFDRRKDADGKESRVHMLSVSAVLETSHRIPNLDYHLLMKLTLEITKDFSEVLRLFRLMCFNVFSHNRDDHSKNFSFLYDEQNACYRLAPAYDLTYSSSLNGEHATTVNGNGVNPGLEDILAVADKIGIRKAQAGKIARDIRECVNDMLAPYLL